MIYEKIQLFEDREDVFLETFCADKVWDKKRDAILVIPGGGYNAICSKREGEPIALRYASEGINAFVLHYSIQEKSVFPRPLIEASAAIKHIRDNREKYKINPDRVFAVGFSAGGHLCASLGTLWHMPEIYKALDMEYGYNKPTGIIPVYPVISGITPGAHMESFCRILGKGYPTEDYPTHEELARYSLENCVDEKSSPAFIVHTSTDALVSVNSSLAFAQAYANKGRAFELHIYKEAPHGISLCNDVTSDGNKAHDNKAIACWVQQSIDWMQQLQ